MKVTQEAGSCLTEPSPRDIGGQYAEGGIRVCEEI